MIKRLKKFLTLPSVYIGAWTVYFAWFWLRALTYNEYGGLSAGYVNIWGDWALHFTIGSSMAYRRLIVDQSPLLIHSAFAYPFFVDFVSAVLIRAGMPFF